MGARRSIASVRVLSSSCVLIAAVATALSGCRPSSPRAAATAEAPLLARASDLSPAERQWGIGPKQGKDVTYRPDVVLLDEGPGAIVGLTQDGGEWIIDGASARARDLQPGRVVFATSRVVGRILHVRPHGDNLALVLGPVELTEVVSHLQMAFEAPIDFGTALEYPALPPGLSGSTSKGQALSWRPAVDQARIAFVRNNAGVMQFKPVLAPAPSQRAVPVVSPHGLGIRINVEGDGAHFDGEAMFVLAQPTLKVDVVIDGAKITRAVLELQGAAGLTFGFKASTDRGLQGNFDITEPSLPTDLVIPIVGPAFPMTVNLRQGFTVETAWGGKGSLSASADFTASGNYSIGYDNGSFGPHGPTNFKWTVHPLASVGHVSAADTGMVMGYQAKVIVGIGGYGFATGPFLRLHTGVGISAESSLVTLRGCRNATIRVSVGAGFGYFLPQPLVAGINAILRQFNLGQIRSEGGVEAAFKPLLESHTAVPPIPACEAR